MDDAPLRPVCIEEAARLLPWFVNGTLSESQAGGVAEHLKRCAICREDADDLSQWRLKLRLPGPVEHAPHAGWQKLRARIDEAEGDAVARPHRGRGFSIGAVPGASGGAFSGSGTLQRWLPAVAAMQALALAALGAALLLRPTPAPNAEFRTLSTARAEPPGLRVVFAPATTLAELQALLQANQLSVLAGPSDAGIFTLALRSADAPIRREDALARLRADPRVRFAEPVGGDPDIRP
jgi:hypothetical protein